MTWRWRNHARILGFWVNYSFNAGVYDLLVVFVLYKPQLRKSDWIFWPSLISWTLHTITIRHLLRCAALHSACPALWSVAQFMCWISDQYLSWLCLKVHQRSRIRAQPMCFCLHDETILRLSPFAFIDLSVMAIQNLDSICSCVNKKEHKLKIPKKHVGEKYFRAIKGGFDHCFLQRRVSKDSLHLPEILLNHQVSTLMIIYWCFHTKHLTFQFKYNI